MKRLIIVGLPRCGTTLVATLLGAQPGIHFLTDYFPVFTDALVRLEKPWNAPLSEVERRIALALVRDQFLRVRHAVLVKLNDFSTLDDLHRCVSAELASEGDLWVGHKLLLTPELLRATLDQTALHCLVLFRDPRDAALSYFHRTGTGVEAYLRNWSATVRAWHQLRAHPRLLALRFEDLLTNPERALQQLGGWLGRSLDPHVSALRFQRSRAHGSTAWSENSAFQDVRSRFDPRPLGRWKAREASSIVRYAGWVTHPVLPLLGYEAPTIPLSLGERAHFRAIEALDSGERRAYAALGASARWLRRRLTLRGGGWTD